MSIAHFVMRRQRRARWAIPHEGVAKAVAFQQLHSCNPLEVIFFGPLEGLALFSFRPSRPLQMPVQTYCLLFGPNQRSCRLALQNYCA